MRSYPQNSPQAAARIVAMTLMTDGHVDRREERVLEELDITRHLGLHPGEFAQIVKDLHEDQLASHFYETGRVDSTTVSMLTHEIDSPILRRKVLQLCFAVIAADEFLADGEIEIVRLILTAWATT